MKKKLTKPVLFILCCIFIGFSNFNKIYATQFKTRQQQKEVTGKVTDASTGEPLTGVSVIIKGTMIGTTTNVDGNYAINADPNSTLQFSFLGYLDKEITVGDETVINVLLEVDIIGMEEVIVTGYGVQKKSDVTGSIASVSSDKIEAVKIATVDQALQGMAAGVNIIPKTGRPGEEAVIQIRGISSINGTNPLVIVDGVKGSFDQVAPNDIESIEVLKDASSAAIYGATGGNGVIIITTKKGIKGKMRTNLNFYQGIETPVSKLDLMNSEQWLAIVDEIYTSDTAITTRRDTMPNYDWQDIIFQPAFTQNYDLSTSGGNDVSTYLFSASYHKQEGIIRSSDFERIVTRLNSEHKISKRITFDEKISYTNRKNYGFPEWQWSAYYDGPMRQGLIMPPNVPDYDPDIPNYNEDGDIRNPNGLPWGNSDFGRSNPLAMLDMIDRVEKNNSFNANIGLKINILSGLSFTSRFIGNVSIQETKEYQNAYYNTVYDFRLNNEVKLLTSMDKYNNYTAQQMLNYKVTLFDKHNITLLGGMEAYREWSYDYSGERNMVPNAPDFLQYYSQSVDDTSDNQVIEGSAIEERRLAYFGRMNYDYAGKYLLTVNIRYDGSSTFGPAYRFGLFPAFSFGWKFSEENFMNNLNFISFGKLRFGYGQTGTYARSGYPYESIIRYPLTFAYPFDNSVSSPGAAAVQIANPEIHWERVNMTNFGIDLTFFQNRLSFTAEYYQKINDGMLMFQEVPFPGGSFSLGSDWDEDETSPEVNIGSLKNSGMEFTVGYKNRVGDLKYGVDLNMSTLKNEVLELATDSLEAGSVHNVTPINMTRIGGSVAEFYGYNTDGMFTREDCKVDANGNYVKTPIGTYIVVNQPFRVTESGDTIYAQNTAQPGDMRYTDENGDNQVLQPEDKVSLGSPLPKLVFGFSFNLEYKGLDLNAQFNGTWGNKIFNGTKQYLYYYHEITNRAVEFADHYVDEDIVKFAPGTGEELVVVKANRDAKLPRNSPSNYIYPRDFYIEDGSYLRLRNITLGYTIPQKLTQFINIEKLRVYVGGRNLITLTKYSGINPEVGDYDNIKEMGIDDGIYPVAKMIFWGANVTF